MPINQCFKVRRGENRIFGWGHPSNLSNLVFQNPFKDYIMPLPFRLEGKWKSCPFHTAVPVFPSHFHLTNHLDFCVGTAKINVGAFSPWWTRNVILDYHWISDPPVMRCCLCSSKLYLKASLKWWFLFLEGCVENTRGVMGFFVLQAVSGNSIEERLLKKSIKHMIQELAAWGDCSTDFLSQVL